MDYSLLRWILDFLTDRVQYVRAGNGQSSAISVNRGVPQGSVLSPLLYILYTNDCVSHTPGCSFFKFADDTAIVGLLTGDETGYRQEIDQFHEWCTANSLILNILKTKEMVINFRKRPSIEPISIHGSNIDIVEEYKYLGTIIDNKLTWKANTLARYTKAQQRLYFLRKLRSFKADTVILRLFYLTFIQSVVTFAIQCWGGGLSVQNRNMLDKITKLGRKITGSEVKSITQISDEYTLNLALKILDDPSHPLFTEYSPLPSGLRYRMPQVKTNRAITSFVPKSIQLLNRWNSDRCTIS